MVARKSSLPKWLEQDEAQRRPPGVVTVDAGLCNRWQACRAARTGDSPRRDHARRASAPAGPDTIRFERE